MIFTFVNNQANDQLIFLILIACLISLVLLLSSLNYLFGYYFIRKIKGFSQSLNDIYLKASLNKFKYLESLSKNNSELVELFENLSKANTNFIDQLKIIKLKIEAFNIQRQKYQWKRCFASIKTIQSDLKKCVELNNKINEFSNVSTSYNRNVNELLVDFRILAESLIEFYYHNLSNLYKINDLNQAINLIRKELVDYNLLTLKINNQKLLLAIKNINQNINNFYYLIENCYQVHLGLLYLKNLQNTYNYFDPKISYSNQINNIINELNNSQIINAEKQTISLIQKIEKELNLTLKNISQKKVINFFLDQFQNFFDELDQKTKPLWENFEIINQNYFRFEIALNKHFYLLLKSKNSILKSYQNIIDTNKNKHDELIAKINILIKKIQLFLNQVASFKDEIKTKYEQIKAAFIQSYQIDNILKFLLSLKKQINDKDQQMINNIQNAIELNLQSMNLIKSNFWKNYQEITNNFDNINSQIKIFNDVIFNDLTLRAYNERLLLFSNKLRANDDFDPEFVIAEKAFENNRYQESIDLLLEINEKSRLKSKNLKKYNH